MNDIAERSSNPFAGAQVAARPAPQSAMVAVEQQRVMAEVQAQMLMARANPRDPVAAMDRVLNSCSRPTLANQAVYTYSKGGSNVSGPSIRLAECLAQAWGNIKTSVRELEQRDGASTMQVIAWDLETGYNSDKVFHVQHVRHTKNGVKRLEDPRDIYELTANQAARRLRACILAVIPGDVTEAAVAQCETTMHASADTSPEATKKMLAAFEAYGVTREQIEKRIQRRLDAIQPAQVVNLKKVYASLRDGMSAPADWFDPIDPPPGGEQAQTSAADKVKAAMKARAAKTPPANAKADPQTGELKIGKTIDAYRDDIDGATDAETAAMVLDEARDVLDATGNAALVEHYRARWAA